MRFVFVLLVFAGLSFLSQPGVCAGEEPALNSVSYERQQEGAEIVQFSLNGPHIPKIFMLTGEKPRLVIDFLDTRYSGKSRFTPEDVNLITGIRIGIHEKPQMKTRVVIDLDRNHAVSWQQDFLVHNNQLVISILPDKSDVTEEQGAVPAHDDSSSEVKRAVSSENSPDLPLSGVSVEGQPADQKVELVGTKPTVIKYGRQKADEIPSSLGSDVPVLLDVSFENNPEKGEMILFKLDDFHPPVVSAIEKGTPRIVCDFYNMRIDKKVKDSIVVGGEYIQQVRVARHENPGKVRAVLDLVPGRDYGLQQVFFNEDNLFVLMVNLLTSEDTPENPQ